MGKLIRPFASPFLIVLFAAIVPAARAQAPACDASTGRGANYSGQDLTNRNFRANPPGSLVGANFTGARLSGAVFAGQDLTNARFQGADLGPGKRPVDFTNTTLTNTCFAGANLDATDFTYSVVTCADFSATSLMRATFGPTQNFRQGSGCRTRFVRAQLDVRMIANDFSGKSNWSKSDFTSANFQNLSPATFSLRNKDITGAILANTNFTGIDMSGANLTNVDFSGATLTRARLDGASINGAKFVGVQAGSASFVCAQGYGAAGGKPQPGKTCPASPPTTSPQTGADFTQATLTEANFTSATLDHAEFAGASLTGATFAYASLAQASLEAKRLSPQKSVDPATVQFASFTNTNFASARLSSVDFSGGTLTGAIFDNTTLTGTLFNQARMPKASFQSAKLQSVNFGQAILQASDFTGVELLKSDAGQPFLNFQCAHLGGANFKDAKVHAGNFTAAVMPAATECCAGAPGAAPWCGLIDATQQTYPPTIFPIPDDLLTCPNGEKAQCAGAQWKLSANWQTTACNRDGQLQTMWSRPQCDGKPGDIVLFKDRRLKDCILQSLPGQTEVLAATAEQIAQVVCPGLGITDLTGLERFTSLSKLDLTGNRLAIFSLAFTAGGKPAQSKLRSLDLSDNQLTTLDVSAHPGLISLIAANNQLASLTASANFAPVVLDLSHNKLATFDVAIQGNLAYVDLSHNLLTSVTDSMNPDLSRLGSVVYVDLSHNLLTSIGSIRALAWNARTPGVGTLRSLFLACNPGFNCQSIGIFDGTTYPAASSSMCSSYDVTSGTWKARTNPDCPAG